MRFRCACVVASYLHPRHIAMRFCEMLSSFFGMLAFWLDWDGE